jgi:hypothetical protein
MRGSLYNKNKENINDNLKNINQEKITINSITDLLKMPISKLNHAKFENFSGDYFDKIYQEAINSENLDVEDTSSKNINKSKQKKKLVKEKKLKRSENSNNNLTKKNKRKKKLNTNDKNNINNIVDKNDFFVEELDMQQQPDSAEDKNSSKNQYMPKTQLIDTTMNKKEKNIINDNNYNKKINKITPIDYQQQTFHINDVTPFANDRQIYMYGQMEMETPGNDDGDNDFYIKNNYYMTTPTPNPNAKDAIDENILYPLIKIIFSIHYNSTFGEEVYILGSSPKLGMWKLSGALPLKWNQGNLWKGEIKIEVDDLQDFEFKFVIVEKGKIKIWESGENNVVNFTGLINQFQFNRFGRYNKYEYEYNPSRGSLLIKCHWKK